MLEQRSGGEQESEFQYAVSDPYDQHALFTVLLQQAALERFSQKLVNPTVAKQLQAARLSAGKKLVGGFVNHCAQNPLFYPPTINQWCLLGFQDEDTDLLPGYTDGDRPVIEDTFPKEIVFDDTDEVAVLYSATAERLEQLTNNRNQEQPKRAATTFDALELMITNSLRRQVEDIARASGVPITDELKAEWGIDNDELFSPQDMAWLNDEHGQPS